MAAGAKNAAGHTVAFHRMLIHSRFSVTIGSYYGDIVKYTDSDTQIAAAGIVVQKIFDNDLENPAKVREFCQNSPSTNYRQVANNSTPNSAAVKSYKILPNHNSAPLKILYPSSKSKIHVVIYFPLPSHPITQ